MFKQCFFVFVVIMIVLHPGCTSDETRHISQVDPDTFFFDYTVWGDEESGYVTAKFQYRVGGPDGTTVVLDDPARVEMDGELLLADSSRMNGAWYESNRSLKNFTGRHIILYTDINKKQYKEEFDFRIFSLMEEIPSEIERGDLVVKLDGLAPRDYIRVLLTDTSFYSRGIDRLDTVYDGRMIITRGDLENLKNGPISIEFYRDDEKSLKETTKEGGRLLVSYGLKRVFHLKD